jgi:hypothetical protein
MLVFGRWWLACAVVLATALPAKADELALEVDAACADPASIRAEVEGLLGRRLRDGDEVVRARLAIAESEGGFTARIAMERDGGATERAIEAATCERLASALALMLALALDPDLGQPPDPGPEIRIGPTMDPEWHDQRPPPVIEPEPETEVGVSMGLAGGVELGIGPELVPAVRAFGGIRVSPWLVELDLAFAAPATAYDGQPGATAEVWFAFAALRGGAMFSFDRVAFGGALEVEAGFARGSAGGARVVGRASQVLPYVGLRAVGLFELRLVGPLGLRARVGLGTPIVVPAFEIQPIGALDRPSSLLFGGDLGILLELS